MKMLQRIYYVLAGLLSWVVFGAVSLVLNFVCAIVLVFPGRERRGPAARQTISRLFGAWCAWLHATRQIYVTWRGFTPEALAGPAVYVANHPGLLDATFILARLPNTICIFKHSVMNNPALGPAAILAGYASGDAGVDLIREVAKRVAAGRSLLIFPEGTRSQTAEMLPFKKGGFLMALKAQAPIVPVAIQGGRDAMRRGSRIIRPVTVSIRVGAPIETVGMQSSDRDALIAQVRARIEALLAEGPVLD